jgi:transcription termination factor NusB
VKEVDKKVVIDNAVKLAKKFVDEKDYAFINAILDKVL